MGVHTLNNLHRQITPETHLQLKQPTEKRDGKTNRFTGGMGLLRFERKSMAPEATRIPSYPTGPNLQEYYY